MLIHITLATPLLGGVGGGFLIIPPVCQTRLSWMFQLTKKEWENLLSQFATSRWGERRKRPYAFPEQGVAMLSAVLRSNRYIRVGCK